MDAQTLARLARIDPVLLCPVKHRSAKAQADLMLIRARAGLVRSRTALVNTARGLAKSYGERLRGCNVRNMNPEKAEGLSPELQAALEPLLNAIESLSERIVEYNERIENRAQQSYPQVALLKQIKGVGTLIALTYMLTLEDPHRFRKSRDVGCYLGLQPGRRNSGQSEPQLHISKEGDPYLRTLLVQGAQHILGPFGIDCDLRRWGLRLAERGGKSGKKRAIVGANLLHCRSPLSLALQSASITWERTASRRRPAFSSHLVTSVGPKAPRDHLSLISNRILSFCSFACSALASFRMGMIGVGIFPENEEVFVSSERPTVGSVDRLIPSEPEPFTARCRVPLSAATAVGLERREQALPPRFVWEFLRLDARAKL